MLLCSECILIKFDRDYDHLCEQCQIRMKLNVHLCTLCSLKLNKCQLCLKLISDEPKIENSNLDCKVLDDFIKGKEDQPLESNKIITIDEIIQ